MSGRDKSGTSEVARPKSLEPVHTGSLYANRVQEETGYGSLPQEYSHSECLIGSDHPGAWVGSKPDDPKKLMPRSTLPLGREVDQLIERGGEVLLRSGQYPG